MKKVKKINRINKRPRQAGFSLLPIVFLLFVLALIGKPAMEFYERWQVTQADTRTSERLQAINDAIKDYVTTHGRYPCASPIDAPLDDARFGKQVSADCTGNHAGTQSVMGQEGRLVRLGGVPVRTLGLPDSMAYDGYNHRYVYAVTEVFSGVDPELMTLTGAIKIVDANDRVATQGEGNVIYNIIAMGDETNGAHDRSGALVSPCSGGRALTSENCNGDATFRNAVDKSYVTGDQRFTQLAMYEASKPCENKMDVSPAKTAYLLDTSGSMQELATCPEGMSPPCSRMDAAHWALRRAVPMRQLQMADDDEAKTDFTGFITRVLEINVNIPIPVFADQVAVQREENIETRLEASCPSGQTPLGVHLMGLAERLGDGTEKRPNSITVVSDGLNNQGMDPLEAAGIIANRYPHLQVNIIDITGNPAMKRIAERTGGKYYQTADPKDLLDTIMKVTGTCTSRNVPTPVDKKNCG